MKKKLEKIIRRKRALGRNPLILGIDVGSESHSVAFLDQTGKLLAQFSKVENSRESFDRLLEGIRKWRQRYGFTGVYAAIEPTGHYWRNIAYYLFNHGVVVRFIRTTALKSQRELDDSSPSKNDDRDAVELGMVMKEGRYLDSAIPQGIYLELRGLGKHRQRLMEGKTATVLRLGGFLDTYFPGLRTVFWSLDAKGLWRLLREAPFPSDVLALGEEKLNQLLAAGSKRKGAIVPKAKEIMRLAGAGIALPATESALVELKGSLALLECYDRQLKAVRREMERVIRGNEYCDLLRSIPGVGTVTIATFMGELGDPANFNHPNEVVSFCGLDPSEASSGKFRSGFRISKKGRYLMRTMLYYMGMRVIRWNTRFKSWYERKMKKHDLTKKSALMAVCIKLIRIIFAMFKHRQAFNSSKLEPKTIRLRPMAQAA